MALFGFFRKKRTKKRILSETLITLLVVTGIAGFVIVRSTQGATYTWDGEGTTNDWSECTNWSSNTCPTGTDIAQFNNTSDKDATIDTSFTGSVAGVTVASGYDGTITQALALQVGGSHFSQAAGNWDTNGFALTVVSDGNFTVSAGSMDATGSTISTERNFTHSGGTLISTGTTLTFTSSGFQDSSIMTCTGTFNGTVDIQKDDVSSTNAGDFTLSSACIITLATNVDTKGSITNNGTIYGTNIYTEEDFTQAASAKTVLSGVLTFDDTYFADSAVMTCTGVFNGTVDLERDDESSSNAGDFTLSSGCTITMASSWNTKGSITNNGTIIGTDINTQEDFTQGAGAYTSLTGTLTFTSDGYTDYSILTCSGSINPPINITKTDISSGNVTQFTLESGCTATLTSDLSYNGSITVNGKLIGGNLTLEKNYTQGANGQLILSGTLTFASNHYLDTSTVTCTGFIGPQVNITKDSESVGNTANFVLSSGCEINLVSNVVTGGDITNNGTMQGTNLTTYSSLTNAGILQLSGTLTLGGTGTYDVALVDCTGGNFISGDVELNKTSGTPYLRLESDCTFPGNFTRTNGIITDPTAPHTLTVLGNFSMSTTDTFGGANLTLQFGGPNNQTIAQNAGNLSTPVVINKPGGKVTQATNLSIDATGQNLTITDGEYSNGAFTLSVSNVLTVGGGELHQGTGNISAAGYTVNDGGTWINSSTGDVSVGASGVTNNGVIAFGLASACGATDNIAITSSSGGAQRAWSGSGGFQFYDISVTDQGGSADITAFSSTSVSNNDTNWDIQATCPATAPRLGNNARLRGEVRLD